MMEQLAVLSNRHRRQLLGALAQTNTQNSSIAPSSALQTDGGNQDEATVMHHVHLPKLVDHGYIDWDQEAQTVAKGPQFDVIEPLLAVLDEAQDALFERGVSD